MTNIALNFDLWPRQLEALKSKATELLFGGASEGGKSHFIRVLLCVLCLAIPNLQCVLIRKKFKDILTNHVYGPNGFLKLLEPLIKAKVVKVTKEGVFFPRGSVTSFQHCQDERQFDTAQGTEKHVLVVDEATQIPKRILDMFRGWVRMPVEMQAELPEEWRDKLPLIVYTANPIGVSMGYFRRAFVKARPAFAIEQVHGFLRQYIPSRATDNRSIDQAAHEGRLAAFDKGLAEALDKGDWDAPVGDFFRDYDDERHVIPDFDPPEHWFKYGAFDWGSSDPFYMGWWTVSDGNPFPDKEGNELWVPRGSIICYREWYGANPEDPSLGIGMRNEDIAKGIRARTREVTSGLIVACPYCFNDSGHSNRAASAPSKKWTIADEFKESGVPLIRANTNRIFGSSQVKGRLKGKDGRPLIYFVESCKFARDYLPAVETDPTNPECYVEDGEATHAADAIRYAAATRPLVQDAPKPKTAEIQPQRESNSPNQLLKQIQQQKRGKRGR